MGGGKDGVGGGVMGKRVLLFSGGGWSCRSV